MNRAMYSGVAGLKTHQTRMDVIGNNIANVNTVGYKSQTALFAELLYQNSSNATGPNADTNIGGINPKQVGLGAKMASINTNITLPGSAETTNNPFDIRLTGSSFFIVNNGKTNMFTRDGSFKVDAAGNLVMSSNGYKVQGWQPDTENPNEIKQDTVSALQIMSAANMTYPPEATTQAVVSGIVDADSPEVNSTSGRMMNLNFYDARGYSYTAKLAVRRVDGSSPTVNSYSCEVVKLLDASGKDVTGEAGMTMKSGGIGKEVTFYQPEKRVFPTEYTMKVDDAATAGGVSTYTFESGKYTTGTGADEKTQYIRYTIDKDGIKGYIVTVVKDGTDTAEEFKTEGDGARDAEEEVATKIFGYKSAAELKSMIYTYTKDGETTETKGEADSAEGLLAILNAQKVMPKGTDPLAENPSVQFSGKKIDGCVIDFSKDDGKFKGINGDTTKKDFVLAFGDQTIADALNKELDAASFRAITIDFSTMENVGNEKTSTFGATSGSLQNLGAGRMTGKMSGISIGNEGKIYAAYDNGQTRLLGQIAVARFANAAGLQKEGENLYTSTQNSGEFDGIGVDVTSDGGKMTPGELEMSNVDLSGELTGMIVTQRGFQANSRIITVSDTMLEELINLKR